MVYNDAPTISGGDGIQSLYKGSLLQVPEGIQVEDDYDKIEASEVSIDDKDVDYDVVGEYQIVYEVEDSWGRKGTKPGTVKIMSALEKNSIDIFPVGSNSESDEAFSIQFNQKNQIQITNESDVPLNASAGAILVLKIKIHDSNGKVKEIVELKGSDTGESVKLTPLHGYQFDFGDYLSFEFDETNGSALAKSLKIEGTLINRDNYPKDEVIDALVYFSNTRFKLTDIGLEAIYNKAPEISFTTQINTLKGNEIDYSEGVVLSDDHDILNFDDNVEVTVFEGEGEVGEDNTVTYVVTDSWGRKTTATRKVTLQNALAHDIINIIGIRNQDSSQIETAFKIGFDIENQQLKITDQNGDLTFNSGENTSINYYTIRFYSQGETNPKVEVVLKVNDRGTSYKIDALKDFEFKYGDYLTLDCWHAYKLKIDGPIRNQREDYSDGVQNAANLKNVKFVITDAGLKSVYTDPNITQTDNFNIISPIGPEGYPIQYKVDPATKLITILGRGQQFLSSYANQEVFKMELISGTTKKVLQQVSATGSDRPNQSKFEVFDNRSFEYGDYIRIWHILPENLAVRGEIEGAREDYSNGVDNPNNMYDVLFKLTPNGMEAVYMEAPTISGVRDHSIEKDSNFNLDSMLSEITVNDVYDGNLKGDLATVNTVDPSQIGLYDIQYSVTNSFNRTTRKVSTVTVYATPKISFKDDNNTVELGSVPQDQIEQHLKEMVQVTDEEDNRDQIEISYTVNRGDFNPDEEGTYDVTYTATDSDGYETIETLQVHVTRTINVSVPVSVPFQVVTNLLDENADPFIAGVMKIKNNHTSPVDVYLKSFNKVQDSGELQLVDGDSVPNWDDLSKEESMVKMALGLYKKYGFNSEVTDSSNTLTQASPLWLTQNMNETSIGQLPRAESLSKPSEAALSFVSKHGKYFDSGKTRGKFTITFEFR